MTPTRISAPARARSRTPQRPITLVEVMTDPNLLGNAFPAATWRMWFAVAAVLFGLPYALTPEEQAIVSECLGGRPLPARQVREGWLICGRRSGKSRFVAAVLVYLACFRTYRLAPGERGVLMCLAKDRRQARVIMRYVSGLLRACPMLARLIEAETRESISLTNHLDIEIHTASFRSVRGYTVCACVADEAAFWESDELSADPDVEVLSAIRPAMSTVDNALLLVISSPYARRGALWTTFDQYFGKDDPDTLVWRAPTWTMNPLLPREHPTIVRAFADDEAVASAEYGAEFRKDIERLLTREAIAGVIVPDRGELPPYPGFHYTAFVDPSGGSADSFTLAIAHGDRLRRPDGTTYDAVVLDLVHERRPPFSPDQVVESFCELLRRYHVSTVHGDRYAGEWPRERFRAHGINYVVADRTKSELYTAFLPLVNSQTVDLYDHPKLVAQLLGLERRTARSGRDSIDHAPGGHDDVCNAAAGACLYAQRSDESIPFATMSVDYF